MEKDGYSVYLRIFMGLMFFVIGISKFFYFRNYVALIPFGSLAVYAAAIVMAMEIIGGMSLTFGKYIKYSSYALIFVLAGALIFVIFPDYALNESIFNLNSLPVILLHFLAIGVLLNFIANSKD